MSNEWGRSVLPTTGNCSSYISDKLVAPWLVMYSFILALTVQALAIVWCLGPGSINHEGWALMCSCMC